MARRKNSAAVELGRRGGKIGGKRSLVTMTAEQRSARARKAVRARWAKAAARGQRVCDEGRESRE